MAFQVEAGFCHFDHQFVTLSHDSFASIQNYFSDQQNSEQISVTWQNDDSSDMKGFLKFSDGTYIEFWDSSKMNTPGFCPDEVGFQDGCRLRNTDIILKIAHHYCVDPFDVRPYMMTVGRRGMAGEPWGGTFFIWHANPELDTTKFGIRQILKNVPADLDGKPHSSLVSDYCRSGMRVHIYDNVLRAEDYIGVVRVAMANPAYPVGLVEEWGECILLTEHRQAQPDPEREADRPIARDDAAVVIDHEDRTIGRRRRAFPRPRCSD